MEVYIIALLSIGIAASWWLWLRRQRTWHQQQRELLAAQESLQSQLAEARQKLSAKAEKENAQQNKKTIQAKERRVLNALMKEMVGDQSKKLGEKKEEIKQREEQLEEFARANSHEIRRPVARIKGLISLIRMEDELPPMVDTYLNQIHEAAKELDEELHRNQERLGTDKE